MAATRGRVMESYERWLQGTSELEILYLMGLFDRPAGKGALDALLDPPTIAGLTANVQNLTLPKWQYAVGRLRDLRLLAEKDEARPETLDCHPLVREHFGEKLRGQNPAAWKEAHGRLYEYYKNLPAKHLPDTLEEMEPLFAAVAHGCMAGRHQEALDDVYWERIRRSDDAYSVKQLGAFGADLSALSNFFEVLWSQPASGLKEGLKAAVLSWAGFRLQALGRLAEASQPTQAGLDAYIMQEDWRRSAMTAGNLSELYLTLGKVSQAVASARQSVDFADRSGDEFWKMGNRTTLADALHQSGELTEVQKFFREAEAMQKQSQPEYPHLYSLQGFRFCDLLLSQGQYQEVQKRANQSIKIVKNLLSIALDTLPRPRLSAATAGRRKQRFANAEADLEEAREIAERGEMNLHLADYHLEACRLHLAQISVGARHAVPLHQAREHLETAAAMITKMGYHRRDAEVAELRQKLA